MARQVQLRRGTAEECAEFTGAIGELIYETDTKRLVVHDGETKGGESIPNNTDVSFLASSFMETQFYMAQKLCIESQNKLIKYLEYLEDQRDYENGNYKYVITEGEGDDAVSTTWYSWCFTPGCRHYATMENLVQMDLDIDAEREAERLPDDPPIKPSTYYQTRIPAQCRLINYPDDLLPITDKEVETHTKLVQVIDKLKELQEKYGVIDEEDEENSNNEDSLEQ